jgi:hypothetical protein
MPNDPLEYLDRIAQLRQQLYLGQISLKDYARELIYLKSLNPKLFERAMDDKGTTNDSRDTDSK